MLAVAGALEAASEHPIARAIAAAATERTGRLASVEQFTSLAGLGVRGTVGGRAVVAGRPRLLAEHGLRTPAPLTEALDAAAALGRTPVLVGWDGEVRGVLVVADTVKPTSAEAVRRLRALGLRPVLLTGDNAAAARAVAAEVGIDDVVAEVLPQDKVAEVRRLQQEGRVVAMVGDGVNDAAALAQADLGLAMGTGTDAAIEASDLTLVRGDLRSAADAIRLSRRTLGTIKGNLFWAFAYNVAAIPLAAAGLLNPLLAGGGDGPVQRLRGDEQPAAARVPAGLSSSGPAAGRPAGSGPPPAATPRARPVRRQDTLRAGLLRTTGGTGQLDRRCQILGHTPALPSL